VQDKEGETTVSKKTKKQKNKLNPRDLWTTPVQHLSRKKLAKK
jgi:hypothetical protein